jgi:hypothetical protein
MRILTSSFANVKKLPAGLVPVSIACGAPRWFRGHKEPRLAPTRAMLKMQKPEYDRHFAAILAQLDPVALGQELPAGAVLCCWEKPDEWCHRRLVAEWLEQALGIEVPEFGLARADCIAYRDMGPTSAGSVPPRPVQPLLPFVDFLA